MADASKETAPQKTKSKVTQPMLSTHLKAPPWLRGYLTFRVKEILDEGNCRGLLDRKKYMIEPELLISVKGFDIDTEGEAGADETFGRRMPNSFLQHVFDMNACLQSVELFVRPRSAAWKKAAADLDEYLRGSPIPNICTCIRALGMVNKARRETDDDLKYLRKLHEDLGKDIENNSCGLTIELVGLMERVMRLMGFPHDHAHYCESMKALRNTDTQIHDELCQTVNWIAVMRKNRHMPDLIRDGSKRVWAVLGKIVDAEVIKSQEGYLRRMSDALRWQLDEHIRENIADGTWRYLELLIKLLSESWVENEDGKGGST